MENYKRNKPNRKPRVLLVSQHFHPENFKSTDIALDLIKKGFEVDVIAGIPNYPQGVFFDGYNCWRRRYENFEGVNIYRIFQFPRGRKSSSFGLVLNYLSFAFFSSLWVLFFFVFKKKYDRIFVFQVSPITQVLPAILYSKLRNVPLYIWVLDLWPNAAFSNVSNSSLLTILNWFTNFVYRCSTNLLLSSKGFKKLIENQWKKNKKCIFFPNWSDDLLAIQKEEKIIPFKSGFNIVLAGNLGSVQIFDSLLLIIKQVRDYDINWYFIGDGSSKKQMDEWVKNNGLANKVFLLGKYPYKYMRTFFTQADLLLLTLKTSKAHLDATVPARLQSYMSVGKPILSLAGSACNEIIKEADCGFAFDYNDTKSIIDLLCNISSLPKEILTKKGNNARTYFLMHYTKEKCLTDLLNILNTN